MLSGILAQVLVIAVILSIVLYRHNRRGQYNLQGRRVQFQANSNFIEIGGNAIINDIVAIDDQDAADDNQDQVIVRGRSFLMVHSYHI